MEKLAYFLLLLLFLYLHFFLQIKLIKVIVKILLEAFFNGETKVLNNPISSNIEYIL